ncbi:DUF4365 domain-containing protein [Yinghuangia sp. YIM S09857]|uniref:DUF4365 domain-containing protein n=1 Tax=Yinghuangia sp. YIM S09857 TaxID=3436929 RepID=UPI003F52A070
MGPDDLVDGQLPMTAREEHFSLAFLRLIVYEAGCSIKAHETDYDGVDVTIVSSAQYDRWLAPQFELQMKCTTQQDCLKDDHVAWRVKAKPFRKLTAGPRFIPAYLGVLVIPPAPEPWLNVDHERLLTRSRLFWRPASELATTDEVGETRTVHLPRRNLFAREQLLGIMKAIGDDEGGAW